MPDTHVAIAVYNFSIRENMVCRYQIIHKILLAGVTDLL